MATTYHTQLQQLYVAYFNRPADPAGLAFYEGVLEANASNVPAVLATISADFAASAEYKTEYDQLTNTGVVTQVYQNLFGRAPDASGLAFWVARLGSNDTTIAKMVVDIAAGAQLTDKVAFDSKVVVATAFTNALNTEAEIAGYGNEVALDAAKALISTIKTEAQATAAIVPAKLDASVAVVVKAGTPFTLEAGLAALGAAQADIAEFLDDQDATPTEIADAVTDAEDAIAELVADPLYGTSTNAGVKAALLAEQMEINADDLEAANAALTAATTTVAGVKGLAGAIAAATSATEGVAEAEEAAADAAIDAESARLNLDTRNTSLNFTGTLALGTLEITDGADVVAEIVDGELVLGEDIDAADYAGLAAFVTAGNNFLSATADLEGAEEAALLAQLQVELLDVSTPLVAGTFTFTETTPANASKETFSEILDELSARTAEGTDGPFRTQISNFISANITVKANALTAAEIGTIGVAKANIAAVTGLSAAIAAQDDLTAATEAADEASDAYDDEATAFGTANAGLTINANGTVDVTTGGADVVVLNSDGDLEAVAGVDDTDYAGLTDFIAAGNARIDADAAATAAALTPAETTLLTNNAGLIAALATAEANAQSSVEATRVAALGTEGAQAAVDALMDAQADLEEAQAVADEYEALTDALDLTIADFEANDYNEPDMLDTATAFGRTGSDIFVVTDEEDTVTITNFGRSGDDVLYIGSGYTLNTGDFADDGNNAVLEVFFVQQGNNTIVTIETETFGSNSGEGEITITLTGVNADELTFENGIISL